ncbi:uncharacterized protein NECHADRAFT_87302 [Fusarium vanettenii 77-13-4]|uniref:SRPBCC family protein n=1 Tax=Fusarium vanettenii (strain ATCC MYA-4622 / CBS 123669 / FGSC 9596 / NRRL 45880 / 77-13-4) TaxID=660122 RepID=C7ZLF0_FUSV7|nr:uncharacterized protein NECHADRAFT_87302 [Fusarium vanettenii 77-13-4]EEU35151.1 hypothetical protein NECHADRAFT_87302 [Fusarium vanettenii 77-13-4]
MEQATYPGDDIIPDAEMIYNQTRTISASAADIFPWVVQLGKGRGGWYLTSRWERMLPKSWVASRVINPTFQQLKPGDRVPDYGTKDDYFDVVSIDPPRSLIYESLWFGTKFTWAILLHETESATGVSTVVHLRFRGKIAPTGLRRRVIVWLGGILDHTTTAPMLAGLAERVEREHVD